MSRFVTLDVFTRDRFAGNPLAVFPDARAVGEADLQRIARELNLSETVFLLPPESRENTARVRIFTPAEELPFAGHPNVGAALLVADEGLAWNLAPGNQLRFEEGAGLVTIDILRRAGEHPTARVRAPAPLATGPERTAAEVAGLVGLDPASMRGGGIYASVGAGFLIAETGPAALASARPDSQAFVVEAERLSADGYAALPALFLFARTGDDQFTARMFAPLSGIVEDPATGSAAAALGALLFAREGLTRLAVRQGAAMGRPSEILVDAGSGGVWIAGAAVPVFEGRLLR
ncbi:MAG: PhzF family phenazine biosynthesis protein [Thermaurantiacus sp.]